MPFVLLIGERSNSWAGRPPALSLHSKREQAEAALLDYVKRNWQSEMDEELPDDLDDQELIEQYFDEVLEMYDIQEVHENK